ncbi:MULTISPECIES: hypothetical protein [Nocardiaceae]|uniref:hypothetical protein n=1 Tax=Nocardiaceae TaxID=85025 RepID=UPI000B9A8EF4|nr:MULTISPECIES: hypothetical protein [Rhodococcus]OZD15741.1 hypothetical protein CH253_22500 [Rhodococcus sp. 06-156-3C]OZD21125.1 hypothetical protein CH280_02730 [Rhodococcus sp. 06-156-4C]OZD32308.1 hypothetical protein CH284_20660 [Rhodococcus sp. 06-156-3]OZF59249.1 hypothetical protein CH290_21555 [Rhodococcus sp. 06-156-4]
MTAQPVRSPTTDVARPLQRSAADQARGDARGISVDEAQAQLTAPEAPIPCRKNPSGWDIDRTGRDGLRAAVRACRLECPLLAHCRVLAQSGAVRTQSMVWAGIVHDERGRPMDLDDTTLRVGTWSHGRDTRIPDGDGRIFNGHTGRWERPITTG